MALEVLFTGAYDAQVFSSTEWRGRGGRGDSRNNINSGELTGLIRR